MTIYHEITIQQNRIIISLMKIIADEALGDNGGITEELQEKIEKVQTAADNWLNPTLE